jgi:hypothetical protein
MTDVLKVTMHADKSKLQEQIKYRTTGCNTPLDWQIREPVERNKRLWLPPKAVGKKKGSLVLVKRLMYYWEYGDCPPMPIKLVCGNKNCVNPAHMRITGYEKEAYQEIEDQIERGILYPDDAKEWFGYVSPEMAKTGAKAATEQL